MPRRILFYVQHLLGIGHVVRAARISRALCENGFEVRLIMGGFEITGLDLSDLDVVRLPAVKAGPDGFTSLVTPGGQVADDAYKARRCELLLEMYDAYRPDAILIEAFPFGRRQMRFELDPLLTRAKAHVRPPLVVSSVRDIIQESRKPGRAEEVIEKIDRYFDAILVHGDADFVDLGQTFPAIDRILDRVHYTGIVAPKLVPVSIADKSADVVVTAGGGAFGQTLLKAAIAAKPLTALRDARWLVSTGPNIAAIDRDAVLASARAGGIEVTPFIENLAGTLHNAKLSISQAGYNTVADVLVAGCRSVLCPYAEGGETEQSARAELLSSKGRVAVVGEEVLSPEVLARAIDEAYRQQPGAIAIDLDGAKSSAVILARLMAERH